MMHLSTIKLLREWARWGQGHSIDYPSMSPMFGNRALKSRLYGIGYIPPDVLKVEQAVCKLDWRERQVIIYRYQRFLNFTEMGERLEINWRTARQRLQQAEREIHHDLHLSYSGHVCRHGTLVASSKTVTA